MNSFEYLQDILLGKDCIINVDQCKDPFTKRFLKAYKNGFIGRSSLDVAILIRQILLHENTYRNTNEDAVLILPFTDLWPNQISFNKVSVDYQLIQGEIRLSASYWKPSWLKQTDTTTVESDSIAMFNVRDHVNFKRNEIDYFLKKLGFSSYNSLDQKKATRNALSLEPGKTLAVSLPTGEGKSLIFQLISQIGFYNSHASGITVVIVPTIALAIDHEKSMQKILSTDEIFAYLSDDPEKKEYFKSRIKDGTQSIIFTSPEAVYMSLRDSLIEASKSGFIRAFVVDEAHIIEEWGNDFRHEFQLLSGLWRQLLRSSPKGNEFRTLMLSATYTQESINVIHDLFTKEKSSFEFYNASKLRPEIDYWVGGITSKEEQKNRLVESLYHLPRPLIVYASKQSDARNYFEMLKQKGFDSIAILHGGSSSINRTDVVTRWKNESLDVVVATSAFGMGIDYAHVRSIVHACVPETMNRFYQEVGRGGRDGCQSLSLLLPTKEDKDTAKTINSTSIIGNEKGFDRWQTMFENKISDNQKDIYIIDIGVPPKYNRDLNSKRHYTWNFQVLNIMARAGMICLEGVPHKEPYWETPERYISISIVNEDHLNETTWCNAINPIRSKIYNSNAKSLKLMYAYLDDNRCPAELLSELYSIEVLDKHYNVSKLCTHCTLCRVDDKKYEDTTIVGTINKKLDSEASTLLVTYEEEYIDRKFWRKLPKKLDSLLKNAYQCYVFIGNSKEKFLEGERNMINYFDMKPSYIETIENMNDLVRVKTKFPQQKLVIFIGDDISLTQSFINNNVINNILVVPHQIKDPRNSSPYLKDVYPGEVQTMREFIKKV